MSELAEKSTKELLGLILDIAQVLMVRGYLVGGLAAWVRSAAEMAHARERGGHDA